MSVAVIAWIACIACITGITELVQTMTNESDKFYFNLKEDIYIVDSLGQGAKSDESCEMNLSIQDWFKQKPGSVMTDSPESNYLANVTLLSSKDPTLGTSLADLEVVLNSDVIRKPVLWDTCDVDFNDLSPLQFPFDGTEPFVSVDDNDNCNKNKVISENGYIYLSNIADENVFKKTSQNALRQICTESNVLFDKNMNVESFESDDGDKQKIAVDHSSDMILKCCDRTTHIVAPESNDNTSPKSIGERKKTELWVCDKPNCDKVFQKRYEMELHILEHGCVFKPFKCSIEGCAWSFPTLFKLKRHEATHLKKREYMCYIPGCQKYFTTIYNLNTHLRLHKRPANMSCLVTSCGLKFKTRREMEYHMKTHGLAWAPYKCKHSGCEKTFYSCSAYTAHARSHQHEENELLCQWEGCGRLFDKPCRLKAHMRQHTGDKPYKCNFENCAWAFSSASKLKRHQYTHNNERNFKCTVNDCHKAFQRSEHLKEHTLTHFALKAFECNLCGEKFNSKSSRHMHFKKYHPDHDSKNPDNVSDPSPTMSQLVSDPAKSQTLVKQNSDIFTELYVLDNVSKFTQTTENMQSCGTDGKPMSSKRPRMRRRQSFGRGCARTYISYDYYQLMKSTRGTDAMQNTVDNTAIEQSETTDPAVLLSVQDSLQDSDGAFYQTEENGAFIFIFNEDGDAPVNVHDSEPE